MSWNKSRLRDKSKNNELILVVGKGSSKLGDLIFDYSNNLFLSTISKSSHLLAIYQCTDISIRAMSNLFGGALCDKKDRKSIMIATDLLCAILCFGFSVFYSKRSAAITMIILNLFITSMCAINAPAYRAIAKEAVQMDRIGSFNSLLNTVSSCVAIFGPLVAMELYVNLGARCCLLINAITFLSSAILESMIRISNADVYDKRFAARNNQAVITDILDGFRYLKANQNIFGIILISSLVNFFLAGYNLCLPYFNEYYKSEYAYMVALIYGSIGGLVGSILNLIWGKKRDKKIMMPLFLCGISLVFFPILSDTHYLAGLLPNMFFSAFLTVFNIRFISTVQHLTENDYLGRVLSIVYSVATLLMPVGTILFSVLNITDSVRVLGIIGVALAILSMRLKKFTL
mgnify:FL=1